MFILFAIGMAAWTLFYLSRIGRNIERDGKAIQDAIDAKRAQLMLWMPM